MSRVSELEAERDVTLSRMEQDYRARQEAVAQDKEEIKSRAEEKHQAGEDISKEQQDYLDKQHVEDRNYYEYDENRTEVWEHYSSEIENAKQEEATQEEDYGY